MSEKFEGASPAEGDPLGEKLREPLKKSLAELDTLVRLQIHSHLLSSLNRFPHALLDPARPRRWSLPLQK